jgi:hypothetical protein
MPEDVSLHDDLTEDRDQPFPALFPDPPVVESAAAAVNTDGFMLRGGAVDAYFLRRADTLLVTFDNLGSIGEYDPPQPWLQMRADKAGLSILGLMATQKDWYRNPETPALIASLRDAGFFAQFSRIVFTGTSMGGYAALTYARMVPGAAVLAFSPQTTLSRDIAPFERRYRYAFKKWDWTTPDFLDAAETATNGAEIHLVYDPFVPEDHAHARRVVGPQVHHLHLGHQGHRAVRQLKAVGLLQDLIEGIAFDRLDAAAFFRGYRVRRENTAWQRALFQAAEARDHLPLARRAAEALAKANPEARFPGRAVARLKEAEAEARANPRPDYRHRETLHRIALGNPQPPFGGEILELHGARVVPERDHDVKLASGVLRRNGRHVALSRAWIRAFKPMPEPTLSPDEKLVDLPGRHLFAGHFRGHFGHFLVESTARLWALDHIGEKPDSILYLPYRGSVGAIERAMQGQEDFFRLLDIDIPIRTYPYALRVENLYIPELGFGWQERYAGSPAYRAFMQGRLSRAAPAEGGDKLYVSRARLNAQRGGVLGETVIEENLARAGYEIFHPERHSLATQIARYKAARKIVALDGSALHLAAYVMQPGGEVAMILRRSKANAADYRLQFKSFCGIDPHVIDVIAQDWIADNASRVDFRSVGEIDFVALFRELKRLGYLPARFKTETPGNAEIKAMLRSFEEKRGGVMRALKPGEKHLDDTEE